MLRIFMHSHTLVPEHDAPENLADLASLFKVGPMTGRLVWHGHCCMIRRTG